MLSAARPGGVRVAPARLRRAAARVVASLVDHVDHVGLPVSTATCGGIAGEPEARALVAAAVAAVVVAPLAPQQFHHAGLLVGRAEDHITAGEPIFRTGFAPLAGWHGGAAQSPACVAHSKCHTFVLGPFWCTGLGLSSW